MMVIDNKYSIGETIYLRTDIDQKPGIVTSLTVCPNTVIYNVSFGRDVGSHYDFEMTAEKDVLIATNN